MRFLQTVSTRSNGRRGGLILLLAGLTLLSLWQRSPRSAAPAPAEIARLRASTPPGMALVPGGDCWIGSDDPDADDDVKPRRRVAVPSYYIDTREVTNAAFHRFDPTYTFLAGKDDLPATHITYDQAAAYAKWAGKRLPTEDEWEKAARGTDGRRYPWGDVWDARKVAPRSGKPAANGAALTTQNHATRSCNIGPPRTQPVGSVASGVSPYGCYDMAGNAWEWVQGYYNGNPDQRILRGGAVGYGEFACRTYIRAIEGAGAT